MGHSVSRLRKRVNQGLTIRRHSARTASASRARGRSAGNARIGPKAAPALPKQNSVWLTNG